MAVPGPEGGALVGLPVGGSLTARLGSRRSLRLALAVYPTALPAVALASGLGPLGLLVVVALVPVLLARRALDPRAVGERQPSLR